VSAAAAAGADGTPMTGSERPVKAETRHYDRQKAQSGPTSTPTSRVHAAVTGARIVVWCVCWLHRAYHRRTGRGRQLMGPRRRPVPDNGRRRREHNTGRMCAQHTLLMSPAHQGTRHSCWRSVRTVPGSRRNADARRRLFQSSLRAAGLAALDLCVEDLAGMTSSRTVAGAATPPLQA